MKLDKSSPDIVVECKKIYMSLKRMENTHQQKSKLVKGERCGVWLTENSSELLQCIVETDVARVVNVFDTSQQSMKHRQSKEPDLSIFKQVKEEPKIVTMHLQKDEMSGHFIRNSREKYSCSSWTVAVRPF